MRLAEFLTNANDLLFRDPSERGRFIATQIGVVDTRSGAVQVSHAGDANLTFFRRVSDRLEYHQLNQVPALAVFGSDMFPPGMRHTAFKRQLDPGDVLIERTDGIEGQRRLCRTPSFEALAPSGISNSNALPVMVEDEPYYIQLDEYSGIVHEEFGRDRIRAVVEALQSGSAYMLKRYRNPIPDERLELDFSQQEPSARNTVLAVMAAELVFRLVPDPSTGPGDAVRVNTEVNDFLKDCFSEYDRYFAHPVELAGSFPESVTHRRYSHIKADAQNDTNLMMAIRRRAE